MKKSIALLIVGLCCIMTACSAKPADSQTTTESSATVKSTTKPVQTTTEAPSTKPSAAKKPTDPPTEPPTDPPTEPPKDTTWKQLYIDFINSLDDSAIGGYQLIYIDNDEIPELAAPGVAQGKGFDYIGCIDGDDAVDLFKGDFCTVTGQEYYRWDGVDYPSYEEYSAAKNRDFDKDSAQSLNNLKSYSEICKQIKDY